MRLVLHKRARPVFGLLAAALIASLLNHAGWPWWAWLPAALIAAVMGVGLHILLGYGLYRLNYRRLLDEYRKPPVSTRPPDSRST